MSMMPPKAHFLQIARFCIVGAVNFVTGLAMMIALCEWVGLHYVVAYVVTFLTTNMLGYVLNGRFTFAVQHLEGASLTRYAIVNAVLFGLNALALTLLVEVFHFWYVVALTLLAGINIPVSFAIHRSVSYGLGSTRQLPE